MSTESSTSESAGSSESPPVDSSQESPVPAFPVAARLAVYLISTALLTTGLISVPAKIAARFQSSSSPFPWSMFFQELLLFIAVFLPAVLLARLERRRVSEYGLPLREFLGVRFWQGSLMGLAEISLLIASIKLFGGYTFGSLALPGVVPILQWLLFWFAFFVLVGIYEEFAFRGYSQFTLSQGIGFWPAALLLSLGFGAVHLLNPGENWVGAAGVTTVGLVFALALRRTGNLWFLVGWHAAFDFGETFLYSVPDSGALFSGHLFNASLYGPAWLTGGSVGPEGSVFSFIIMGLSALFIDFAFPPLDSRRRLM